MRTNRFCNNLQQVRILSKDWKANSFEEQVS